MEQTEQKRLTEKLLAEKKEIENQLSNFANKNPLIEGDYQTRFNKSDQSDTLDEKARNITDYEEERAVEQNLEVRLKEINETLEKLEKGTYGICDKCSSPIDPKRLVVIPVARFCVDCANKVRLL
jgi:RNA polymerase-binding transcription factor DksA